MGTHSICLYKEVAKQYTSFNPKSTELFDCALIGVCAVIRSNTGGVFDHYSWTVFSCFSIKTYVVGTH